MASLTNKELELNTGQATKVQVVSNPKNPVARKISNATSTSIIKIIPNNPNILNKVPLPQKCSVKTFLVSRQNNLQPQTSPSTNTSYASDHEYVCKEESIEDPVNIVYLNNESLQVTEDVIDQILQNESDTKDPQLNHLKRHIEDDILEFPDKMSKVHSESCCCVCRNTLESILQKQEEILSYLKNGPPNLQNEFKFDLLPAMPFNDLNDFLDFDESLSNENVLEQLIIKLQKQLVSIDKKSVSNVMASIMTNELCKRISWIGIKDTIAFQNTNIVNHIIVSSKSEQSQPQQQQQLEAAVSEVPQSNATKSPTTSQVGSSEEVKDSSEKDDAEEDSDSNTGGEDDEEDDDEEDGENDKDEGSMDEEDEYADELRAAAGKANADETTTKSTTEADTNKEVSELHEHKRRKKTVDEKEKVSKDKRVPSVKKELSSQKEIFIGENETRLQLDRPVHTEALEDVPRLANELTQNELEETESEVRIEQEKEKETEKMYGEAVAIAPMYTVLRAKDALKKLSKRQNNRLTNLKAYLLDERLKLQQLGNQEGSTTEGLLKLLSKLAENPQHWERVHQLLTDIRADMDYSRQAIEAQKRLSQLAKPLTRREPTSTPKPSRKPKKKKKKKKKKPRQRLTTTNMDSSIATTEMPWHSTLSPSAAKWRLVAERLLGPSWSNESSGDDDEVVKLRSSAPSKARTMHRPLDDKQLENLKALNSERQALMLKAAREYSKPRAVHYGKIRTHQQSLPSENLSSEYNSNQRSHYYGKLISPSSSHDNYPLSPTYSEDQSDLMPNLEYLPAERDFSTGRANSAYRWPGSRTGWNWRQVAKPWIPWDTEREYYARLEQQEQEEALKNWQQAQQRQRLQDWNRHRGNLPPWLEEKELHRMMPTAELWPKPDHTRPQSTHREQSEGIWGNNHNNNSGLKNDDQSKVDEDSKESPKLTMKTWNSLTSDPATWPFKLPGAKPWPKDENGKTYNPNAELVRKLGLYKNDRPRPDSDALKDLKQQQKMQNNIKVPQMSSKLNSWMEPDEQQTAWFNDMKLHGSFEDSSPHWNNENLSSSANNEHVWPREKIPEEWNAAKTASSNWPTKWKQFAYHKVTAQPTSDKPNKNAFIAVSAVSAPRYGNAWRKNNIEEIGQANENGQGSEDPDLPMSQMRMNVWKKSTGLNMTSIQNNAAKVDVLESQLESLKEEPVLLEVNVSIKNSTSHEQTESSTALPNTKKVVVTNKRPEENLDPKKDYS